VLAGEAGNDELTGGDGADRFVVGPSMGIDTITDFSGRLGGAGEHDRIDLRGLGLAFFDPDRLSEVGGNVEIDFSDLYGAGNKVVLEGVEIADLHQNDFLV
jgi:serralysin